MNLDITYSRCRKCLTVLTSRKSGMCGECECVAEPIGELEQLKSRVAELESKVFWLEAKIEEMEK